MDFKNHIPIYLQIIEYVKRSLVLGELAPGDKLPSVREMANDLQVNPNTVQKAYQEMERNDFAFSKRGIGTFITEDPKSKEQVLKELSKEHVRKYISEMKSLGNSNQVIIESVENALKEEKI